MDIAITASQVAKMRHALGLDRAASYYRNRYTVDQIQPEWEDLISKGLAFKTPLENGVCYRVSIFGKEWLREARILND